MTLAPKSRYHGSASWPAMQQTPRAVAPPADTGDASSIVLLADPLPTGGGSFLVSENARGGVMARTTDRKTEMSRAAIYARVSDKSQGRGGQDLHLRADRRDGSLLRGQRADHHCPLPGGGPGLDEENAPSSSECWPTPERDASTPSSAGSPTASAGACTRRRPHGGRRGPPDSAGSRHGRHRHEDLRPDGGHRQDRAGQLPGAVHSGQAGDGQAGTGAHRRPPLRIPHRRRRQARCGRGAGGGRPTHLPHVRR